MAIQVSGTEVISNSRVLSNVTGLKTVAGNSILGSGDIVVGPSTAVDGVGSYTVALDTTQSITIGVGYKPGRTAAGSSLQSQGMSSGAPTIVAGIATSTSGTTGLTNFSGYYFCPVTLHSDQTFSGSWRLMSPSMYAGNGNSEAWYSSFPGLWVRYA